ncbi:PIN domain-containing protein [Tistrella mobilis]|uniref:PIN domain-containing protein n=1 Tax=Tistrella mobilis TaxID=171437 RepID=UPI0031F7151E
MSYRPPVAVYDACVLYPFHLRNLLMQLAVDGLVEAKWSQKIHEEWIRNLVQNRPDISRSRLEKTRDLMCAVLPDADVVSEPTVVECIQLPDIGDRHVVATAISAQADVIITWNVSDFPQAELARHDLRCQTPDLFLCDLESEHPDIIRESVEKARRNLRTSTPDRQAFLASLDAQRLTAFVARLRAGN